MNTFIYVLKDIVKQKIINDEIWFETSWHGYDKNCCIRRSEMPRAFVHMKENFGCLSAKWKFFYEYKEKEIDHVLVEWNLNGLIMYEVLPQSYFRPTHVSYYEQKSIELNEQVITDLQKKFPGRITVAGRLIGSANLILK